MGSTNSFNFGVNDSILVKKSLVILLWLWCINISTISKSTQRQRD